MNGPRPKVGLILSGGARAAYQVGVLRAVADILPPRAPNPFPVICGTSAGAINAVALAADAGNYRRAVLRLAAVWKHFHVGQVYRDDPLGVLRNSASWIMASLAGGSGRRAVALLDNTPLAGLLASRVDFGAIQDCIDHEALHALSITCSGYTSGQSVCFYQGHPSLEPWRRARRIGVRTEIRLEHLLASSALPFIFPPVRIHREYFGDGSMRQIAPVSPALHLGADRVLVIGVGRQLQQAVPESERVKVSAFPTLAEIAGHSLNSIFLDAMEVDLERMQRINKTLSLIPPEKLAGNQTPLRPVDFMVITPSQAIEKIAIKHAQALPATIRLLLRGVGGLQRGGSNLLSYLLFERPFCRELIALGYQDTMARKDNLLGFLGYGSDWYCELPTTARGTVKRHSEACERNAGPILEVLREAFADRTRVLEVGSGTGQHAVAFARALPHLVWQPSDLPDAHASIRAWSAEAGLANLLAPIALDLAAPPALEGGFDAMFSANVVHIVAWPLVERVFALAAQCLPPGGVLALYGPFNYGGQFTSPSNAQFDLWLKSRDPASGIRDIEAVTRLAHAAGLSLACDVAMPANNRTLVYRRPL